MRSIRFATPLVALVLFSSQACAVVAPAERAAPNAWLVVGPLPAPAPLFADGPGAKAPEFTAEIDPRAQWPEDGRGGARRDDALSVAPAASGGAVTFATKYLAVDRFGAVKLTLTGPGRLRMWVDGDDAGNGDAKVESTRKLARGLHRVTARCESNAGAAPEALALEVAGDANGQDVRATLDPRHAPASYDEFRAIRGIGSLAISPDGKFLAIQRTERAATGDGSDSRLDVLDLDQRTIRATALCGRGASAVTWQDDSSALLIRQGTTLRWWRVADGSLVDVLKDEPGLGAIAVSRDGATIVFASTRGVAADPPATAPRHRTELRERLSDWPTDPYLWLLDAKSGARRRLTTPGDFLQDAFAITPDAKTLVFFRNVPRDARPWFASELHALDLASGADRVVTTLTMGFEGHPGLGAIALDPAGTRIAFVAPPSELGSALKGVEPNAFAPALWVTDLATGATRCVSEKLTATVDGALHWSEDGRLISFLGTQGSRPTWLDVNVDTLAPAAEDLGVEAVGELSVSKDGGRVAWTGSATDRLPALYVRRRGDAITAEPWIDPNADVRRRIALDRPQDLALVAADGATPIEGWLYRPANEDGAAAGKKTPLVVYYYGGATPTTRGWNDLHAFLAANGYAVLVVNPRGCGGYGRAFADQHVAEWGEVAGRDILAALDQVLAKESWIDGSKVGCYGGSYGGFMTMWLVSHSDKFAAAVSMYGIADIASYFGDGTWGWTYGDQALANTYPWSKPQWFAEHSPLYQADHINTPLLLLHGEADTNVPVGESEQMFTALKLLGRQVELVRFPGEDHGLRGTWTNRVLHRTMLLEWFDRYLKGQGDAWKARWGK